MSREEFHYRTDGSWASGPAPLPDVRHAPGPFCVCPDCIGKRIADRMEERRQHMADLAEASATGGASPAHRAAARTRKPTKDQKVIEAMAVLHPGTKGNMIPVRVRVISVLGVALGFLLFDEVRHLESLLLIVTALVIALPMPMLRRAAASYGRQHAAERAKVRKQIDAGHRVAAREGLWWPEADGSISIGGKPIQVGEADQ